jgi:hypothetical protein
MSNHPFVETPSAGQLELSSAEVQRRLSFLKALPADDQLLLILHFVDRLSWAEIEEVFEYRFSRSRYRVHLHRLVGRLRKLANSPETSVREDLTGEDHDTNES